MARQAQVSFLSLLMDGATSRSVHISAHLKEPWVPPPQTILYKGWPV